MHRSLFAPCLAGLATAALVLAPSREASADVIILEERPYGHLSLGVDLNLHTDVDQGFQLFNVGVDGRIGWAVNIGYHAWVVPELQAGWASFGGEATQNPTGLDISAARLMGGVRFVFGSYVRPVLFAHAGLALVSEGYSRAPSTSEGEFAFDVGGALDFHLTRHWALGAQIAFNRIQLGAGGPAPGLSGPSVAALDYVTFGPHLQAYF